MTRFLFSFSRRSVKTGSKATGTQLSEVKVEIEGKLVELTLSMRGGER